MQYSADTPMERERLLELFRTLGKTEAEIAALLASDTPTMKAAAEEMRYKAEAGEDAFTDLVLKALKRRQQGARGALEATVSALGF